MTTVAQARSAVSEAVYNAWQASATTSPYSLQWDDAPDDPVKHDALGNALPWGRVTVRHFGSATDTVGGPTCRRNKLTGAVSVQIFAPLGDGHRLGDAMAKVVTDALKAYSGDVTVGPPRVTELGTDGPWSARDAVADIDYLD